MFILNNIIKQHINYLGIAKLKKIVKVMVEMLN